MDDEEQQFRDVLGPLFDELSELDIDDFAIDELLTSDEFKRISETTYVMQMPIQGKTAIDLATSIDHWTETQCQDCSDYLHMFTMQFAINLWQTILIDLEGDDE